MLAATDWNEWVAIGTLALAAVTFVVAAIGVVTAWFTRSLAIETKKSVAAAQAEVAAQIRPLLIEDLRKVEESETLALRDIGLELNSGAVLVKRGDIVAYNDSAVSKLAISFPVRNVGVGVAVVSTPNPTIAERIPGEQFQGTCSRRILPVGEGARLNFVVPMEMTTPEWQTAYIGVAYTDISGQQLTRTRFFLRAKEVSFALVGIAIYNGVDESEPPVVSYGEGFG